MFGKFEQYAPIYLRKGVIARLARFLGKYIKRGWLGHRLFNLGYEQMPPQYVTLVAVEDAVKRPDGYYDVRVRIGGVESKR